MIYQRAKFLGSDGLFCYISICKFGSFKNPFDSEDLFCWCKQKKVISMNYGSSTRSWKWWRWIRLDLILMISDIYINSNLTPLTKFTSSSRSTEFKALNFHHEDRLNQHKNSHKLCDETGHPIVNLMESQWELR